ncbi:SRPBCC domain-containing protein, partial [Acinetobacter baumannii]
PHGCEFSLSRIDLRAGGEFLQCIKPPNHSGCWLLGTYLEVNPPAKIMYSSVFSDESGTPRTPAEVGRESDWPNEILSTISFEDLG